MTTLIQERLDTLPPLKRGSHSDEQAGKEMCVMEAVAWIAGEPMSDHPQCASPIITSFLIRWNDRLPNDAERDRLLKPLIPSIIGTRGSQELEAKRKTMIERWAWDVALPRYLEAANMNDHAEAVRKNPGDMTVIRAARDAAWKISSGWRSKLRADVKAAVLKKLADKPDVDAADAAAVAVADAVADAAVDAAVDVDAADVAAAVAAVAAAVAAVADAAVAVADAAVAVADAAVAVAAADAADAAWWKIRDAVYNAVYKKVSETFATDKRFAFIPELQASAQQLVLDMCALKDEASA